MVVGRDVAVRPMRLAEVGIRINYFHDSSDDHLHLLGVERGRLPTPEGWLAFYQEDYARPVRERINYALVWELDRRAIGFSSADRIVFGRDAFMHLHIVDPTLRWKGLGTALVRASAETYFRDLELQRIFCEPNAFNVAPNRTLQRAGFSYLFTHETTPGPINFAQTTTRWVLERPV